MLPLAYGLFVVVFFVSSCFVGFFVGFGLVLVFVFCFCVCRGVCHFRLVFLNVTVTSV